MAKASVKRCPMCAGLGKVLVFGFVEVEILECWECAGGRMIPASADVELPTQPEISSAAKRLIEEVEAGGRKDVKRDSEVA